MKASEIKKISKEKYSREIRWIKEIRQGRKNAFEEMYHFYYARLCQFAYRYVRSRTIAEDLVHNVFFNVWKNRQNLRGRTLRSYLYTAVRNQAFKYLEHRKVRNFIEVEDLSLVKAPGQTPEDMLRGKELKHAIVEAVDQLPSRRRLVYLMHREDELTYREIAEVLEISIKTVETQMSRSLKFLRAYLADFLSVISALSFFLNWFR